MASIRLLYGCVANGGPHDAGELLSVSDADCALLISLGRAEAADDQVAEAPPASTVTQAQIDADLAAVKSAEDQLAVDTKAKGE